MSSKNQDMKDVLAVADAFDVRLGIDGREFVVKIDTDGGSRGIYLVMVRSQAVNVGRWKVALGESTDLECRSNTLNGALRSMALTMRAEAEAIEEAVMRMEEVSDEVHS